MTGYVRVDTGNNIADGNVISAADLDNEFDGVQAAFNASTGHTHDGSAGEGAPITKIGPTQDVVVGASTVTPKTTNTVDIGSSSLKFKDLFLAGNASIAGTLGVTGATTLSAALTYGGVTLSNAVTGTGNMVLSASPTLTGTLSGANASLSGTLAVTGVATLTAQPILSSLTASHAVFTDGSKGLVSNAITGTGNVVMSASPTLTGTISAEALTTSSTVTHNGGTANGVAYLNGSKVLTTGSALVFDGTNLGLSGLGSRFINLGSTSTNGQSVALQISAPNSDASASVYRIGSGLTADNEWVVYDVTNTQVVDKYIRGSSGFRAFYQNGSEQMRLTSTGLGIGTSSPGYKLDVASDQTVSGHAIRIRANATSGTGGIQFTNSVAGSQYGWIKGAATGLSFYGGNNSAGDLFLDSSGNVGIGTSSPNGTLQLSRNASSGNFLVFDDTRSGYGDWAVYKVGANDLTFGYDTTAGSAPTQALTLAYGGNLGLGVTPSAWTLFKAQEIGRVGNSFAARPDASQVNIGCNWYYASGDKYANTAAATMYEQGSGAHKWFTAPSGTAGNAISFTQAMTLDASGNLGVGTTTMTQKVSVEGSVGTRNGGHLLSTASNTNAGGLYLDSSGSKAISLRADPDNDASGTYIGFTTDGTERARIDSSGNVGIGTSSPGVKLDVNPGSSGGAIRVINSANTNTAKLTAQNSQSSIDMGQDGSGGFIEQAGAYPIRFFTNSSERVRVTSAGDVGIGTSSPGTKLQVNSTTTTVSNNVAWDTTGATLTAAFTGTSATDAGASIAFNDQGTTGLAAIKGAREATAGNGYLSFLTRNGSGGQYATERARITSGGDLLVGTTSAPVAGYNCFSKSGADVQLILQRTGGSDGYGGIGGSSVNAFMVYGSSGGLTKRFEVSQAGSCFNTTGTYGTLSDIKVKENIQDSRGYLEDLCRVRVVKYSLKADQRETADKLGVVAQELEQIFPNMIDEQPDVVDGKEVLESTTKRVKYSVFVPMLIKAIQEQQAIITALTARVTALETN